MRSKAPLALMEQMVMLLVFALAAALCLQAFAKSDQLSKRGGERDRAAVLCQSAAEIIRHTGGDFVQAAALLDATSGDQDSFLIFYGSDWEPSAPVSKYTLGACRIETDVPGLGKAEIWVVDDGSEPEEELIRFQVAWQEVSAVG